VASLVDIVFSTLNSVATVKGIHMLNAVPKDLRVPYDREMTLTIIRNLLSNALKVTEKGGTMKVSGGVDADSAFLEISDSGPGFPLEMQDPFDFETNKRPGLGLLIVRDFAKLQNMTLRMHRSQEGRTNILLRFKAAAPVEDDADRKDPVT
jgi:signal transduction histidine kinase